MSALKGSVGARKIRWKKAPVGTIGQGEVEVDGKSFVVAWKRDGEGLWIEFRHGCFGYDFSGETDEGAGGLIYRISERGADTLAYGLRFRGEGESATGDATAGKKRATRVRAQMPGKIVRVLVKAGDTVAKDQPLIVMEAMKMENEIRAASAGKIATLKVSEGQAVESGADLLTIE
jgi:acetyl/propionyl-CoA carboxylase alpha subunit